MFFSIPRLCLIALEHMRPMTRRQTQLLATFILLIFTRNLWKTREYDHIRSKNLHASGSCIIIIMIMIIIILIMTKKCT